MSAEQPFYGRTGLLDSKRDGLAVRKPRLRQLNPTAGGLTSSTPTPPAALKWYPSMLSVPQRLLHHMMAGDSVDGSLASYLRVACLIDVFCKVWSLGGNTTNSNNNNKCVAQLSTFVLQWHASNKASQSPLATTTSEPLNWYLPTYKMVVMKDGEAVANFPRVSHRAVTLLGKDPALNDVVLQHPSCSGQHAALHVQFTMTAEEDMAELLRGGSSSSSSDVTVPLSSGRLPDASVIEKWCHVLWEKLLALEAEEMEAGGSFTTLWAMELQVVDLGSTNGSFVNAERLQPMVPVNVIEGDVLTFGASSRRYVLVRTSAD